MTLNSQSKHLVSIISIVLNGKQYIEETILSVINQRNIDFEYIIIDGGSTDGTLEIIKKYKNEINVFISEPDKGIYDAINKGIRNATGKFIGLINCGDRYEDNVLVKCFEKHINSPEKSEIIYGNIKVLDIIDGTPIYREKFANHIVLKNKMSIFHPATFISRVCYEENGLYNTKYNIAADYDLLLKNCLTDTKFTYIPVVIATFRAGGASGNTLILLSELYQIWRNHLGLVISIKNSTVLLFKLLFFTMRKKIVTFIIGKQNYNKLKLKKY